MIEFEGVVPALGQALDKRGYSVLTPVQKAVLAPELADRDALVSAQTGSGKTVAFGLAIAPTILGGAERFDHAPAPLALVVAPTRELAIQVKGELIWLYAMAWANVASCVGGMDMRDERRALQRGAHIVVGTPGRLRDHIERGSLDTSKLKAVVLDEADEMLDMGFRDDLEYILGSSPAERRTLMFSATVPHSIARLAKRFQRDAVRIATASDREQHVDIEYRALTVAPNDRENAIINVLRYFEAKNALVFCATRATVNRMTSRFTNRGFSVVALSGELSQNERTHALQAMRDGRARVCIATDVAARGLDLPNLELVIHADLPRNRESLLHRSGRTGRAGRKGVCTLIVPYNARRSTERLLQSANIKATWAKPPSIDEINSRDNERLMDDPALSEAVRDDERVFVQKLLDRHGAEQIAAAYLRAYRESRSAPEELIDAGPPQRGDSRDGREKRRDDFSGGVWFALSVGSKHRAEARWLVPMLCRAGQLTKHDIGAIKVRLSETHIELTPDCVERFLAAVGPSGMIEETIAVTRLKGAPQGSEDTRSYAVKRPYTAGRSDARAKPNRRQTRKPDAPAHREATPNRSEPARRESTPNRSESARRESTPNRSESARRESTPNRSESARRESTPNRSESTRREPASNRSEPNAKKPYKIRLDEKSPRISAKPGAKHRSAKPGGKHRLTEQAGYTPLRRKKPKKKSVTIIARRDKSDPTRK
jgi:ATP-dependent RNA helicase DeaD